MTAIAIQGKPVLVFHEQWVSSIWAISVLTENCNVAQLFSKKKK